MINRIKSWLPHTEVWLPGIGPVSFGGDGIRPLRDEETYELVVAAFRNSAANGSGTE